MAMGSSDTKELILKVDAATELARRNLNDLEQQVRRNSASMTGSLARIETASGKLGVAFGLGHRGVFPAPLEGKLRAPRSKESQLLGQRQLANGVKAEAVKLLQNFLRGG
jgi:ABC-type Fe2+-enterobactin transport system substrate-binding protein